MEYFMIGLLALICGAAIVDLADKTDGAIFLLIVAAYAAGRIYMAVGRWWLRR